MLFHFSGNLIARVLAAALRLLGKTIITRRKSLQIFLFVFVQAEHFWLWPWCLCLRLSWKFLGNKEQTLRQSCGKSFCSRGAVQYGCGTVSCFNLWKVDFFLNNFKLQPNFKHLTATNCNLKHLQKPSLWLVQLRAKTSARNYFLRLIDFLAAVIRRFSFNVLQICCVRGHICTECISTTEALPKTWFLFRTLPFSRAYYRRAVIMETNTWHSLWSARLIEFSIFHLAFTHHLQAKESKM